jgi:hypothetical protein
MQNRWPMLQLWLAAGILHRSIKTAEPVYADGGKTDIRLRLRNWRIPGTSLR